MEGKREEVILIRVDSGSLVPRQKGRIEEGREGGSYCSWYQMSLVPHSK